MQRSHRSSSPGGTALRPHLARFSVDGFDLGAFARAGVGLPPQIEASVRRRQAEFFFGRLAARAALLDQGASVLEVPVGSTREPVWPAGIVGSITHVEGLAGAVVGAKNRHVGLGLDIERVARGQAQAALRSVALDVREMERLRALDVPLSLDERVTLSFSAKESICKALSGMVQGLLDFDVARVETIDASTGVIVLSLDPRARAQTARGSRCLVAYRRLDTETFLTAFQAADSDTPPDLDIREAGVPSADGRDCVP